MPQYTAIFVAVDGLSETDMEPSYRLAATNRKAAEDEALNLPRPKEANFIKLIRDGQYEPRKLGFDL